MVQKCYIHILKFYKEYFKTSRDFLGAIYQKLVFKSQSFLSFQLNTKHKLRPHVVKNKKSGLEMKFLKRETHCTSQKVKLVFGKAFLWIQIP